MIYPDELTHLKLYRRPLKLPIDFKDKKHNSLIMLTSPDKFALRSLFQKEYILNAGKSFQSYYIDNNINILIKSNESSLKEEYVIEDSISEMSSAERNALPSSVFGIPDQRKYPMHDKKHTLSAIKLFNHCDPKYEKQLAEKVLANMKKFKIDQSVIGEKNRLQKYIKEEYVNEITGSLLKYDIPSSEINKARQYIKQTIQNTKLRLPVKVEVDKAYAPSKQYVCTLWIYINKADTKFVRYAKITFTSMSWERVISELQADAKLTKIIKNYESKDYKIKTTFDTTSMTNMLMNAVLYLVPKDKSKAKPLREEYDECEDCSQNTEEDNNVVDSQDSDIRKRIADTTSDNLIHDNVINDKGVILLQDLDRREWDEESNSIDTLSFIKELDVKNGRLFYLDNNILVCYLVTTEIDGNQVIIFDILQNFTGNGLSKQLVYYAIDNLEADTIYVANSNLTLQILFSNWKVKILEATEEMVKVKVIKSELKL